MHIPDRDQEPPLTLTLILNLISRDQDTAYPGMHSECTPDQGWSQLSHVADSRTPLHVTPAYRRQGLSYNKDLACGTNIQSEHQLRGGQVPPKSNIVVDQARTDFRTESPLPAGMPNDHGGYLASVKASPVPRFGSIRSKAA